MKSDRGHSNVAVFLFLKKGVEMAEKKAATKKRTTSKKSSVSEPKKDIKRNAKGQIVEAVAQDTNKNGTAGAPSKFDDSYITAIIKWFDGEKYTQVVAEEEVRETKQGKTVRKKFRMVANDLPHLEGFARHIGVTYATLYNWAHEKDEEGKLKRPEFFEAYNVAKQLQKEWLIENGLKGHYPPASFIFVAKNITDMRDTKNIKLDDKTGDGDEISDAELEDAIFNES